MPVFVSGLDLSRRFFKEIVRPLFATAFADLHNVSFAQVEWEVSPLPERQEGALL